MQNKPLIIAIFLKIAKESLQFYGGTTVNQPAVTATDSPNLIHCTTQWGAMVILGKNQVI